MVVSEDAFVLVEIEYKGKNINKVIQLYFKHVKPFFFRK